VRDQLPQNSKDCVEIRSTLYDFGLLVEQCDAETRSLCQSKQQYSGYRKHYKNLQQGKTTCWYSAALVRAPRNEARRFTA
jgi:hypothetical protein